MLRNLLVRKNPLEKWPILAQLVAIYGEEETGEEKKQASSLMLGVFRYIPG
jgi:hypothetical protein